MRPTPILPSPPSVKLSRGYTLIELAVVLAILAVAMAMVAPAVVRGLGGAHLRTSARRMGTFCRMARTSAVVSGSTLGIYLDLEAGAYGMQILRSGSTVPMPRPAPGDEYLPPEEPELPEDEGSSPSGGGKLDLPSDQTLPPTVFFTGFRRVDEGLVTEGREVIAFHPNGSTSGGVVEIADDRERTYLVEVDAITGRVHVGRERRW